MDEVLEQPEVARRLRACLAYANMGRTQAADLLGVGPSTLDRYTSGRTHYKPDMRLLWRLADVCGMPREWFVADLGLLSRIVPPGLPVFSRPPAGDLLEAPPGELGRIARGTEPTQPSRDRSDSHPDTDARRDSA